MKAISILLTAMMVFMVGAVPMISIQNEVVLNASQVSSAADIENAINTATGNGTQPGTVTLDSSQGDFVYTGEDHTIDIRVSTITLRSENGAVIRNCENGVFLDSSTASGITIEGITFHCQLSGVLAWGGHENVTVQNNTFYGFATGVYLFEGKDWTIADNHMEAWPTNTFPEASGAAVFIQSSSDVEINGNQLVGGSGVVLNQSNNARVIKNEITAVWYGIVLAAGASYNQIRANDILSTQQTGVLFKGGNEHNKVLHNTVQCTWSYDCTVYYADTTYTPLSPTNKINGNKLVSIPESNTFTTKLLPGFWSVFKLGAVSDGNVYIADVTPLQDATGGAYAPFMIVPQFDGQQWNDVLRVMVPVEMLSEDVQITIYKLDGLPAVLDTTDSFYPGAQRSYAIAPSTIDSFAYLADIDPLAPSLEGKTIENYLVRPEFLNGQWMDTLRVQVPAPFEPDPLALRMRVYRTDQLNPLQDFDVTFTPIHTWAGFILGPSSLDRGYVVKLSPLNGDTASDLEYYRIQPEFDGIEWNDVLRIQMGTANGDWASVDYNIKVYACDATVCP